MSGCVALVEGAHVVGPHAGGVDDARRADVEARRRRPRRRRRRPGRPSSLCKPTTPRAVGDHRAVVEGGGAGDREREAGVVGLRVVVEVRAGEAVAPAASACGRGLSSFLRRLWSLPMRAPPVRSYIHMALPRARASLRVDEPVLAEERDQERAGRCTRCGAFLRSRWRSAQGLVDEADVALLEVAQPAVDELRRLRRRARRRSRPARRARCAARGLRRRGRRPRR